MTPSRRDLLQWAALAGISLALPFKNALADAPFTDGRTAAGLEPSRYQTLEAVTARILPSDDGPGAREAKVMRFIDRELAGEMSPLLPAFTACASLLDQWSQRRYAGKNFIELDAASQDRIIGELSRGEIPAPAFPQQAVYTALHTLTLEGFLSNPEHGGNAEMIGWRALGITPMHRRSKADAPADEPAVPPRKHKLRVLP